MKQIFAFGYQKTAADKYHVKICFEKKKAFNTFYKNKTKYYKCGVLLCKTLKDFELIKYSENGVEHDPKEIKKESTACTYLQ